MIRRVELNEAQQLIDEGYKYIDVRSEQEFAQGHPEGAFNVPWLHMTELGMAENEDFLSVMRQHFDHDSKLLVGCRSGHRSLAAARRLEDLGYQYICELRCGFAGTFDPFGRLQEPGWQPAGLPTSSEPMPGRDYASLSKAD